ncbi:MAG: hypothetical protein H6672_13890 [Anaerolineaceae bacterium]|nr:hypothetical protein [Anaerolineaceae bacterium]
MLNEAEILVEGEEPLGRYLVEVARWTEGEWVATVPLLDALVTNCRLILKPQGRRPYAPASIPQHYIKDIEELDLGMRSGVKIILTTGHTLYLFVRSARGIEFSFAVRRLLIRPVSEGFSCVLPQTDINRLIQFISSL